jgi:hypothetical protein
MKIKDVSKKAIEYVDAIKLGKWKLAFFYWLYVSKML